MKQKQTIHYVNNMPLNEIVEWANEEFEGNFELKVTQYTKTLKANGEKYFFGDSPMDKMTFIFYQKMLKDSGGEIRDMNFNVSYYDFSGIQFGERIEKCYSVDINSAYLTALKNEKIITPETFLYINNITKKDKKLKMSRLKSVGMFAKNPIVINFEDGKVKDFTHEKSDLSWIFFTACKKTEDAMRICRLLLGQNYLFYWVDGIFMKENPQIIVDKLAELGLESKIEIVENLRVYKKSLIYNKDGVEKVLFLPQVNGEKVNNVKKEIGQYITL
jgi:hypothetical protein